MVEWKPCEEPLGDSAQPRHRAEVEAALRYAPKSLAKLARKWQEAGLLRDEHVHSVEATEIEVTGSRFENRNDPASTVAGLFPDADKPGLEATGHHNDDRNAPASTVTGLFPDAIFALANVEELRFDGTADLAP